MMKQTKLEEARAYEKIFGAQIPPEERPLFHVTPTVGWMNDPNGFSVYQGEYHLFYQYHPYDIHWGPMHWGHMKSRDLIRWERLPAALAPDMEYDAGGIFSGSAVELPDGRQLLMYTGVQGKDNAPECRQTQCLAVGDGINYQKYEHNPVIFADDIPEPCFAKDFRDPKIWRDPEENCFFAVVGIRMQDKSGAAALFSSDDGFHWQYVSILDRSRNQYGRMWECPDFFELGDQAVLIVSPQEMRAQGLTFHNGNDVACLLGSYDRDNRTFTRKSVSAVDYGLDFYAPQTLKTPDGRRILIGWMQAWENSHLCRDNARWQGMLTLPRELSLKGEQLIQRPVKELESYRRNPVIFRDLPLAQHTRLPGISGRILDLTVDVRPKREGALESFTILLRRMILIRPPSGMMCAKAPYVWTVRIPVSGIILSAGGKPRSETRAEASASGSSWTDSPQSCSSITESRSCPPASIHRRKRPESPSRQREAAGLMWKNMSWHFEKISGISIHQSTTDRILAPARTPISTRRPPATAAPALACFSRTVRDTGS